MNTKKCSICHAVKPCRAFNRHSKRKDGLQSACRACGRFKCREYYRKNLIKHRATTTKRKKEAILETKQKVWAYLTEHPCVDCGERDPIVLDFDHQHSKEMSVSSAMHRGWSWDRLLTEIAKCVVRCSNCHRRKTSLDFGWWRTTNSVGLGVTEPGQPMAAMPRDGLF